VATGIINRMKSASNIAYIDGQNLRMGTTSPRPSWKVDLFRFRKYLLDKYNVVEAYYYLGIVSDDQTSLYKDIQRAGFILVFREHNPAMASIKKGNVDTDIVFDVMKYLYKDHSRNKIFLVSADGDYYKLVQFLLDENRLGKVLFPARHKASSLYRKLEPKYFDALDSTGVKSKIAYKKKP
jgi:uncharacterized LabA/DUF88 family protein